MRITIFSSVALAAALIAEQANAVCIRQQEDQPKIDFSAQTSTGADADAEKGEGAIAGAAVGAAVIGGAAGFAGAKIPDNQRIAALEQEIEDSRRENESLKSDLDKLNEDLKQSTEELEITQKESYGFLGEKTDLQKQVYELE